MQLKDRLDFWHFVSSRTVEAPAQRELEVLRQLVDHLAAQGGRQAAGLGASSLGGGAGSGLLLCRQCHE